MYPLRKNERKNAKTSEKKISLENLGAVYDPDFPSTRFFTSTMESEKFYQGRWYLMPFCSGTRKCLQSL